jgi:hypothetical protein
LALIIAICIDLVIRQHHEQTPPDVAAVASSGPVVAADDAAATIVSARLKTLMPPGASWLVSGPSEVSDSCQSHKAGMFTEVWNPPTCVRTVTAFYFFNGSFVQHMRAWDVALRASGWSASGDPMGQPLSYYAQYGGKPESKESSRTYLATSLPSSGPYEYITAKNSSTPGLTVELGFDWAEQPQTTRSDGAAATDSLPASGPNDAVAWIQKPALTPDAIESSAFARYRYVAIASLNTEYYDSAAPSPAPTTNSDSSYHPCISGSGTCN